MARTPRSGTQHVLRAGDYEAAISSVGASLRSLTVDGRDLVVPFDADEVRPGYRGATLAPWPNRIVDGQYSFGGVDYQVPLTEPSRSHALHGLASWLDFEPIDKSTNHVVLVGIIEPQDGFPWRVRVATEFTLDASGLRQRVVATNLDTVAVPWGTGPHPYLVAGSGALDTWTLQLPASQVLEVTEPRLSPVDLAPVEVDAERFDFRVARQIGTAEIDHAFTELSRDEAGVASVVVTDPSGSGVQMTWDAACPWVQVHTADLPGGRANPRNRLGLAVEPMTCAPDAFNAASYNYDAGLVVVRPGESHEASWLISAR
ncbi:aldose 1-epimerase [Microbacterium endophyticum]|uniref:Aldose 1-epimerase n=1 Tax=Microbacterium endophyticum TaxID=1526412 RepID=A0A7W4V303_9MICO|nr:aldose 1-epimerase family protein [Microbacterium endophyticum]MBB2975912.1 aldose 1-epimerase [Microbacterium endophyticum]NIK36395.1 aldose 1-epimerase [Microbacterium endophyticum]